MSSRLPDPEDNLFVAGVDAIKVGIEDFKQKGRARKTAAIRNLYAGILLLCKHLLVKLAPVDQPLILISAKTKFEKDEDGNICHRAASPHTITAREIIQRFDDLDLGFDLSHLRTLQRLRNDIEHYFSNAREEDFENAIVEVQLLVSDLLSRIDPDTNLGRDWSYMVVQSKAFQKRREESRRDLAEIQWISATIAGLVRAQHSFFECPKCRSSHITRRDAAVTTQADVKLKCLQCSAAVPVAGMLETMLDFRFGMADFEAAKGCDRYEIYECPECEHQTYVTQEDRCANCGAGTDDYSCEYCSEKMPIWGVLAGDSFCGDECAHKDYQLSKDD